MGERKGSGTDDRIPDDAAGPPGPWDEFFAEEGVDLGERDQPAGQEREAFDRGVDEGGA